MRRPRPLLSAVLALAAILFTQVAIAAAAWSDVPSPCHQQQAPTGNYCYEHCGNNDLTLDVPRIKVPEPAAAPAPVVPLAPAHHAQFAPVYFGVLPAGPPPRILFRSFRS